MGAMLMSEPRCIDLAALRLHISPMDNDISRLLDDWEYQPGQVVVRKFMGKDGQEKLQLRVDLGLLQMNVDGRPDGKRPFGHESLFDYYQGRLLRYITEHGGSDEGFKLTGEDCAKLQIEALQFHHRYICLLQLEDYPLVVRDSERNLAVFGFVAKYAESEEVAWALRQFEPQLLMILVRARASEALERSDYSLAIQLVEDGVERIRQFYRESPRPEAAEQSGEISSLETWLEEIRDQRPLSKREQLERALQEAVKSEDYEKAARVRDELKALQSGD
jgi:hypothetical protein